MRELQRLGNSAKKTKMEKKGERLNFSSNTSNLVNVDGVGLDPPYPRWGVGPNCNKKFGKRKKARRNGW